VSVKVKPGVEFAIIAPSGYLILDALKKASKALGHDLTITSGTDGTHSGPTDPHPLGKAYDVRSQDLDASLKPRVVEAMKAELGTDHFYGFLEAPGAPNEHFHFQQARGTAFSIEDFLAFDPKVTA
jgi:hypothetical protein